MKRPLAFRHTHLSAALLLTAYLFCTEALARTGTLTAPSDRTLALLEQRYSRGKVEAVETDGCNWYRIHIGQYQGACDSTGREMIAPDKYDQVICIRAASRNYFEATSLDYPLCTVVASDGSVVIPCGKYSCLFDWERIRGRIFFIAGTEADTGDPLSKTYYVLCDEMGREVIPAGRYTHLSSDGHYIYATADNGCGVCDTDGREIVPCRFHSVKRDDNTGEFLVLTHKTAQWQPYRDCLAAHGTTSGSGMPDDGRFASDKLTVGKYLQAGDASAALEHMKVVLAGGAGGRECEYAVLMQEIIVALGKAQALYMAAMDTVQAAVAQTQLAAAGQMQNRLLLEAASKGDPRAVEMLRLKTALAGGNTAPSLVPDSGGATESPRTCSLCNGRGWIAGSRTPTYGNTGTHWCSDCRRQVPASHSHDRCPSCNGRGTR